MGGGARGRQRGEPRKPQARRKKARQEKLDIAKIFARADGVALLEYAQQQLVFSQGDAANAVFYICSGRIKITVVSRQGKDAVVALLEAGDFLGEGCLVGQSVRMTSATAMTPCTLWRIEKETLLRLLHRNHMFSDFFLSHLLTRTIRLEADLVDHHFNSAEKRLARALLLLAHSGEARELPIVPRISQETLAKMIGTTRERVSFFMNKFRKLGLLDYNGELRVYSALLNVILNDQS